MVPRRARAILDPAGCTPVSDLLNAALLGVIEGITEFLPISSTGHLLIAEHWLGARSDLFNIVIQAGAILAVCLIYRQRLRQLATGLGNPAQRDYALKLALAFVITAVLRPIVNVLSHWVARGVAVGLSLLLGTAFLAGMLTYVVYSVANQWTSLSSQFAQGTGQITDWLTGGHLPFRLTNEQLTAWIDQGVQWVQSHAGQIAGQAAARVQPDRRGHFCTRTRVVSTPAPSSLSLICSASSRLVKGPTRTRNTGRPFCSRSLTRASQPSMASLARCASASAWVRNAPACTK